MLYLTPALTAYILILTAVLGGVMGSFAGCMADRLARGEDFLRGRSHCDACGHTLGAGDLIPVFSWLFRRGRCRWCGAKIPARCVITEALSAAAFVGVVLRCDVTPEAARDLILLVPLLAVALIDYDTGEIPNGLLAAIFLDWLAFTPFVGSGTWLGSVGAGLLGGLCAAAPLLLISLVMDRVLGRESMGGGDIKLFFVCGLFFSWRGVLFLLISSCTLGILFALISRKTTGDPENPKAFPFAPAIAAGVYLSLLAAEPAMAAYLNLF